MATKRKRNQYSDDFRASAVLMLDAQGYPEQTGALSSVANHLGLPLSTLRGWWSKEHNAPPAQVRTIKKSEIKEFILKEIHAAFDALPNAREFAGYRDLTTSIAILIDKLQLLDGEPTARIAHEDWRSEAVEYIQSGELGYQELAEAFDHDLARELFRAANVPIEGIAGAGSHES